MTATRATNPPMLPTTIPVILPPSCVFPVPVLLSLALLSLEFEFEFKEVVSLEESLLSLLSVSPKSPSYQLCELLELVALGVLVALVGVASSKHEVLVILTAGDAPLQYVLN